MKTQHFILIAATWFSLSASCAGRANQKREKGATSAQVVNKQQTKGDKKMKVTQLTAEMFKERIMDYSHNPEKWNYKGDRPAIIDFYATWCGPCKATAPVVEKIAEEYAGKIDVYKVDVDQQGELAGLFGVQSIPTLLFIPEKGAPVKSVGAMGYQQFKEAIQSVFKQ